MLASIPVAHQGLVQTKTATVTGDRSRSMTGALQPISRAPLHPVLQLQQKVGNRAVTQMLQAKMAVGKVNDAYEQEADRVADTVMRMTAPLVQRQEAEEEKVQAKLL